MLLRGPIIIPELQQTPPAPIVLMVALLSAIPHDPLAEIPHMGPTALTLEIVTAVFGVILPLPIRYPINVQSLTLRVRQDVELEANRPLPNIIAVPELRQHVRVDPLQTLRIRIVPPLVREVPLAPHIPTLAPDRTSIAKSLAVGNLPLPIITPVIAELRPGILKSLLKHPRAPIGALVLLPAHLAMAMAQEPSPVLAALLSVLASVDPIMLIQPLSLARAVPP